jgi:hypothetical protein
MEMDDREESLIRVEEQLKESAKNQASMIADLREIFDRLEKESKISMVISGDLKAHIEASRFRWDTFDRRLNEGDVTFRETAKSIAKEKEERTAFEQDVASSLRTIKWVFGTLAGLAATLSSVVGIIQFLGGK